LFVGARNIPGSYGVPPMSFLLKSKKGFGLEMLNKERYGMITDSHWVDLDNDDDLDLVFCGDWMKITVLENQNDGTFKFRTDNLGFENSAGLWNTLAFYDFNGDGQLDILAGNAGKNFKWKANATQPVRLYVTDLDGNGQTEPMIFYPAFGEYRPYAGLDQLKSQVPAIRKQFLTYDQYTKVEDISDFDLFNDEKLVEKRAIQELRSMLYLSDNGKYKGVALPDAAQRSTIQDFIIRADGTVYFVGNNADYLTELGKNKSNAGGLIKDFDLTTGTFLTYESLRLTQSLNPRKIVALDNGELLIMCNNQDAYLFDPEE